MKTFLIILAFVLNLLSNFQVQSSSVGVNSRNKRIVGGSDATKEAWPWTVSLQDGGVHFCGGILISAQYILTAAHCFHETKFKLPKEFKAVIGRNILRFGDGQAINGAKLIIHEKYAKDLNQKSHDIALIKLSTSVKLTKPIATISLEAPLDSLENKEAWISGWGSDKAGNQAGWSYSVVKKQVKIKILSDSICGRIGIFDKNTMLCGGGNGAGGCMGDSGGPLSYYMAYEKKWVVVGVASFLGSPQCGSNTVFTKVSFYKDWITRKMREN